MWLNDVVSLATIQSVWGNNVRNHLVQTFDTIAERDAHTAALPDGSICSVGTNDTLYNRELSAPSGWRTLFSPYVNYTPQVIVGGTVQGVSVLRARWRRSYGTHIDCDAVVNVLSPNLGGVAVKLPVFVAAGVGAMNAVLGPATISGPYAPGPAVTIDDSSFAILDPTGNPAGVNNAFILRFNLSYEADEA